MREPLRSAGRRIRPLAAGVVALAAALPVSACSSGDATTPAPASSTVADHAAHTDGSAGGSQYGSHGMEPEVATVSQIAELGPGPSVGETFRGHIGLNVCGRFLDPPPASTASDGSGSSGFTTDGRGDFAVSPPTEAVAGHDATIGELASQAGIRLSSGKVTFAPTTTPAQIDIAGASTAIAGASFDESTRCGDVETEIQLWVYPASGVATGDGVRAVVIDPQDAPVVEDGMAFVIAVMPESSLPTLPPSALLD